jgi:hypothetical protein
MLRIIQNQAAASAKSYYQKSDYYGEGQEQIGIWRGKAAAMLGLEGAVRKIEFDRLCGWFGEGEPETVAETRQVEQIVVLREGLPEAGLVVLELLKGKGQIGGGLAALLNIGFRQPGKGVHDRTRPPIVTELDRAGDRSVEIDIRAGTGIEDDAKREPTIGTEFAAGHASGLLWGGDPDAGQEKQPRRLSSRHVRRW